MFGARGSASVLVEELLGSVVASGGFELGDDCIALFLEGVKVGLLARETVVIVSFQAEADEVDAARERKQSPSEMRGSLIEKFLHDRTPSKSCVLIDSTISYAYDETDDHEVEYVGEAGVESPECFPPPCPLPARVKICRSACDLARYGRQAFLKGSR